MIINCIFDNKKIQIARENDENSSNTYSIIVGRNGTGKSRLLSAIAKTFIDFSKINPLEGFEKMQKIQSSIAIENTEKISKVIAVSTSPFDRFPVYRRSNGGENYTYLGIRGIYNPNLGLAFMGRIIGNLVNSVLISTQQAQVVGSVLEYLGYQPRLTVRAVIEITPNHLNEILSTESPLEGLKALCDAQTLIKPLNLAAFLDSKDGYSAEVKAQKIVSSLKIFIKRSESRRAVFEVNRDGVFDLKSGIKMNMEYSILLETGILRLRDVTLKKIEKDEEFKIHDASSGEQCVVLTFLGIASHIKDNALICIDEPEICLHPEWQEKYMGLLISTFSHFKKCQFIIATHSPQIVANLISENCFVIDIEKQTLLDATQFSRRSIDFQLATVFNAPGFKNEYLSRSILSLLTKIGTTGDSDEKLKNEADKILSLKEKLQPNDPVLNLMKLLSDALKETEKNNA